MTRAATQHRAVPGVDCSEAPGRVVFVRREDRMSVPQRLRMNARTRHYHAKGTRHGRAWWLCSGHLRREDHLPLPTPPTEGTA